MFGLPPSTAFNRVIPKKKFYETLDLKSADRRIFIDQIQRITWANKLAPTTLAMAKGKEVQEIQVFQIDLTGNVLDEKALRLIDKAIPYHILYVLFCQDRYQAVIPYKRATKEDLSQYKTDRYYRTQWMGAEDLTFKLGGQDMDALYANLVRQIAGQTLAGPVSEPLEDSVEKETRRIKLEKEIKVLETKIHREKQLNRQMEMRNLWRKLKKEYEKLK